MRTVNKDLRILDIHGIKDTTHSGMKSNDPELILSLLNHVIHGWKQAVRRENSLDTRHIGKQLHSLVFMR